MDDKLISPDKKQDEYISTSVYIIIAFGCVLTSIIIKYGFNIYLTHHVVQGNTITNITASGEAAMGSVITGGKANFEDVSATGTSKNSNASKQKVCHDDNDSTQENAKPKEDLVNNKQKKLEQLKAKMKHSDPLASNKKRDQEDSSQVREDMPGKGDSCKGLPPEDEPKDLGNTSMFLPHSLLINSTGQEYPGFPHNLNNFAANFQQNALQYQQQLLASLGGNIPGGGNRPRSRSNTSTSSSRGNDPSNFAQQEDTGNDIPPQVANLHNLARQYASQGGLRNRGYNFQTNPSGFGEDQW